MSNPANWVTPDVLHRMAWCLIHFTWQGTAIAALGAAVMFFCRQPSSRYAVAVWALAAMLAAPIATFFFLADAGTAAAMGSAVARTTAGDVRRSTSPDVLPWLMEAWFFGVVCLSLRSAGGFLFLEHMRHKRMTLAPTQVLAMCAKLQGWLGLDRKIRFLECDWLQAPAVIGWFRPIILLPVAALTGFSREQLELVIAHELAHIKRLDPFVNLFQILVETLLFYHPAVWWLNRRIRAEREICCDEIAVSLCGNPLAYARALALMEEWRAAPLLAMAANRSSLSERIFHILGRRPVESRSGLLGFTGGLLLLGAALLAGNASFGLAYPHVSAAPRRIVLLPDERLAVPPVPTGVRADKAAFLPVRQRPVLAHGRRREIVSFKDVRVVQAPVDTSLTLASVKATLSSDAVRVDFHPAEAATDNPVSAINNASSQTAAGSDAQGAMVCRQAQPLPGSRFYGPRTCMPKSQWAQLEARGEDIGPDGRQVIEADAFDRNHVQLTCRTMPANTGSGAYTSIPICF